MLPEHFSRAGVEARHAFLQFRPFAEVTHEVQLAVGDHITGPIGRENSRSRAGMLRIEKLVGQAFLHRDTPVWCGPRQSSQP